MPAKKRGRRSPGGKKKKADRSHLIRRLVEWFRNTLGAQLGDVYGIGLTVLAVLCALGIWFNAAGPVGRFLELAYRGLLGVGGLFTPVLFGYLAYEMFVTRPGPDRPRIAIGLGVGVASMLGLWHLLQGTPDVTAGATKLRTSGGIIGALLAGPLKRLMSVWGASVVLVALLCLGVLILTKTPVRRALEVAREWLGDARERHGLGARAGRRDDYDDDAEYETGVIDIADVDEDKESFAAETTSIVLDHAE